jgi:flagellar L-ring protein precursor FlgH
VRKNSAHLLVVLLCTACASTMESWRASLMGTEETASTGRSPASPQELSIDNKSGARYQETSDPTGPDLTSNELMGASRHNNEKSAYGFRRSANPWQGAQADNEGSVWNPDSQDGFLFSKNLLHKVGDIIIVKLEPDVNDSLNEKISAMLGRSSLNHVIADEAGKAAKDKIKEKVRKAVGNDAIGEAVGEEAKNRTVSSIESGRRHIDVENVAVRITELGPRNTFKVQGARKIFIKNSPYKLKIDGIVRDEDIGPTNIVSSNLVFESKLEIVK